MGRNYYEDRLDFYPLRTVKAEGHTGCCREFLSGVSALEHSVSSVTSFLCRLKENLVLNLGRERWEWDEGVPQSLS